MIKFAHIIHIPMTGVGIWGSRGDEWLRHRIEIFKKYTLQSLIKQTNRQFLIWITFRPEEEKHLLIQELGNYLEEIKMPTIMTFHGLPYWDDKFSQGLVPWIMNAARIIRDCAREKEYKLLIPSLFRLFNNKNKTLLNRLERMLHELKKITAFQDANYIYITRIDSDDMFHHEAVAEIQAIPPFQGALVYDKGYVYNANTNEMAVWEPKTNPPFHTIIFLGSQFFNPIEYLRFYGNFRSHEDIPKVFQTVKLSDYRYCVVVHQKHISTTWTHKFKDGPVVIEKLNEFI